MSRVQFFDFGTTETYLFFRWVRESGEVDAPTLIARAFDLVEGNAWFKMGEDVSTVAKDTLSALLVTLLEERGARLTLSGEGGAVRAVDWEHQHEAHTSLVALASRVLADGFHRVDFEAVAEALLIDAGKWAPDKEPPEIP
jgi:hypothetical protein